MRTTALHHLLPLGLVRGAVGATIHLCGDSTMAKGGDGSGTGTEGWGQYLQYSFNTASYTVDNEAIAGRSARSYTREDRFEDVAEEVEEGDWVVIEFGHNDGGSLTPTDDGRSDCPGQGDETCQTTYDGVSETVLTYPAYLEDAAALFLSKGAKVILSSPTPDDPCTTGTCTFTPNRFEYYAWYSASVAGGTSAGVYYVAHGLYTAQMMKNLGATIINENYPIDHTHTSAYLADYVAKAFVLGLQCGTSALGDAVINSTSSLTSTVLGSCLTFNSSVPI
ncbi:SGNH hydrolase-type esterase domain-containing protein [Xylariales sp. PMI_506]|nr:SGNH hydrolase-type esterase domain-containing protein [Xylariales sp. PMI_506]